MKGLAERQAAAEQFLKIQERWDEHFQRRE